MKPDEGDPPVLSVGVVDGGSADGGACAEAARALGLRVRRNREGVDSPLNVNVVFQLAGKHVTPDFRGVRTGRYSKAKNWLLVQAAVYPDDVTDAHAELAGLLADAVVEAEAWAKRRRVADSLDGLTLLTKKVSEGE